MSFPRFLRSGSITTAVTLLSLASPARAATYHLDSIAGDDTRPGTTPDTAWRSLARANAQVFQPGDRLRFRSGGRWTGQFKPQGSGAQVDDQLRPVVVDRYGEGDLPQLDAEGRFPDTVLLQDVEYWEVGQLDIANRGAERAPWRTGVRLVATTGVRHHLRLHDLHVHDVNGDLRKSHEGCGIFFEAAGAGARFDGVVIEDCRLERTDRNGICQRRSGGAERSSGVVVRRNRLEDIGGDAIKPWGSNGAIVEHNVVRGARRRCDDYAAGIWPWDCDDTVIQFNEVSGLRGTRDGQAFDSDYRCRRSLFQYNYSHDNDGGFFLICGPGTSWNDDTVIRYNVSQHDGISGSRVFHFAGKATGTRIHHNTVHVGPDQDLALVLCTDWDGGWATNTVVRNNLFLVEGKVRYEFGRSGGWVWENNAYVGDHRNRPDDPRAITERPPLVRPGSGGEGFGSLEGYRFVPGTTGWRGVVVPDAGTRDFGGTPLPAGLPPMLGAFELTAR